MDPCCPTNVPSSDEAKAIQLTPAAMAERTGVTIDTLRYYENEGLIEPVERAPSGHRRYSADDVAWVEVLRCLRDTGMTIEQLRRYCSLGAQGSGTEPERRQMLSDHRRLVEQRIAEWSDALVLIDHKLDYYGGPVEDSRGSLADGARPAESADRTRANGTNHHNTLERDPA